MTPLTSQRLNAIFSLVKELLALVMLILKNVKRIPITNTLKRGNISFVS